MSKKIYTNCSCSTEDTSPVKKNFIKEKLYAKETDLQRYRNINKNVMNPTKQTNYQPIYSQVPVNVKYYNSKQNNIDSNNNYFWNQQTNFDNFGNKNSYRNKMSKNEPNNKDNNFVLGYELSKKERRKMKAKIKKQNQFVLKENNDLCFQKNF